MQFLAMQSNMGMIGISIDNFEYSVSCREVNNEVIEIQLLLETYTGYVYDIETEAGTFHAGIGILIVKNTDSLYLTCPNECFRECDHKYINMEYNTEQYYTEMVKITLKKIVEFEGEVNEYLVTDNGSRFLRMENEGCKFPCLFLGKKKYFGIQHINEVNFNPKKLYIKGVEIIKQGKSKVEKEIGQAIMKQVVDIYNDKDTIEIVRTILKESIDGKWNLEDYARTSTWKS